MIYGALFLFQLLIFIFPWPIRRLLLTLIGINAHRSARIGCSFFFGTRVVVGCNAKVGHLNFFGSCGTLSLAENSIIGNLNWFSGAMTRTKSSEKGVFLAANSAITNRHYFDCNALIYFGEYSTFAGVRSQVFTHSIDLKSSTQKFNTVRFGRYTMIGSGTIVLPGAIIPDFSVVSAGSVVRYSMGAECYSLYSGNPAVFERSLDKEMSYFNRSSGAVE